MRAAYLGRENRPWRLKSPDRFPEKSGRRPQRRYWHEDNHALTLVEVVGTQKSPDLLWNGAQITYWGMGDLGNGNGPQKGYWCNERADGDRDWGTFEGKITTSGQQVSMEGTFKFTGGTGKFKGITGSGKYKGHFPSVMDVVNEWDGEYTLASAKATQ